MTNYYTGSPALAGARSDLGHQVGRWWDIYGVGPQSLYVATRATSPFFVSKAGAYRLPGKQWGFDTQIGDVGNPYKRLANDPTPRGKPAPTAPINITPASFGKAAEWDEDDEYVRELMTQGGLALVEEVYLRASLAYMCQGLDWELKAVLDAATLTAADTAATAARWSTSAGTPRSHITTAQAKLPVDANAMIVSRTSFNLMRNCTDMASFFGGAVGLGRLTPAQTSQALSSLGIERVYVGDDAIWGETVYLYRQVTPEGQAVDPAMVAGDALLCGCIKKAGADERGVLVRTKDNDHDKHEVYATMTCDFGIDPDFVCRITDTQV
jgi:hypothetical protein